MLHQFCFIVDSIVAVVTVLSIVLNVASLQPCLLVHLQFLEAQVDFQVDRLAALVVAAAVVLFSEKFLYYN